MTQAVSALADRLGVPESRLTALAEYDASQIATLEQAVATAMREEDAAFDAALDEALRFVPRLLRGAARGLLFPGGGRG